jgi:hypothetical protein
MPERPCKVLLYFSPHRIGERSSKDLSKMDKTKWRVAPTMLRLKIFPFQGGGGESQRLILPAVRLLLPFCLTTLSHKMRDNFFINPLYKPSLLTFRLCTLSHKMLDDLFINPLCKPPLLTLKEQAHENLLCFYWYRWIDNHMLDLFTELIFKNIIVFISIFDY